MFIQLVINLQYIIINFLFLFSRSRNEVDTLQTYKEKCAALETKLEALECNTTKLQEYEQVQLYYQTLAPPLVNPRARHPSPHMSRLVLRLLFPKLLSLAV